MTFWTFMKFSKRSYNRHMDLSEYGVADTVYDNPHLPFHSPFFYSNKKRVSSNMIHTQNY